MHEITPLRSLGLTNAIRLLPGTSTSIVRPSLFATARGRLRLDVSSPCDRATSWTVTRVGPRHGGLSSPRLAGGYAHHREFTVPPGDAISCCVMLDARWESAGRQSRWTICSTALRLSSLAHRRSRSANPTIHLWKGYRRIGGPASPGPMYSRRRASFSQLLQQ